MFVMEIEQNNKTININNIDNLDTKNQETVITDKIKSNKTIDNFIQFMSEFDKKTAIFIIW